MTDKFEKKIDELMWFKLLYISNWDITIVTVTTFWRLQRLLMSLCVSLSSIVSSFEHIFLTVELASEPFWEPVSPSEIQMSFRRLGASKLMMTYGNHYFSSRFFLDTFELWWFSEPFCPLGIREPSGIWNEYKPVT